MILRTLSVGQLASNCYLVGCERTRQGMVIDPGADAPVIQRAIQELDLQIVLIALTHYHFDHIEAAEAVRAGTGAPLAIHAKEADLLQDPPALFRFFQPRIPTLQADRLLYDNETLAIGDLEVTVLHTPGHSPGGISLHIAAEQAVLTGDALFREGIGRTDFPGGDMAALEASIRTRLYTLGDKTRVYPGHGPETTIGWEKRHNPFVRP
jgi:glyoxylase-like metal-dependent hydrolase (beta-lactamase superfamily II)